MNITQIKNQIFSITDTQFETFCLEVFKFQALNNPVYGQYINLINLDINKVNSIDKIPFLPIQFFKTQPIISQLEIKTLPSLCFESSTTTSNTPSKHYIVDPLLYQKSFLKGFERFIGNPSDYCILGLLPSYLERGHSSLIYMVNHLITLSNQPFSGFYLYDYEKLFTTLQHLENQGQACILWGTTHALLDFSEAYSFPLNHTQIIETGGMKGRREELSRSEVHQRLKTAFNLSQIQSEYGMTELLSQAYATSHGLFQAPNWMKVQVRDAQDPLSTSSSGAGAINIIDLANLHSCSFIATEDYGCVHQNGTFEIIGRLQNAEWRGCSLMTI